MTLSRIVFIVFTAVLVASSVVGISIFNILKENDYL
jgi:hypothetical protein